MYVYGSWAISSLKEDQLNYGVTTIPAFANAGQDSVSILSSSGISMSKDSKNKDAAWEFIKFWTNEEANKERIGLELPVLNSVVESEKLWNSLNMHLFMLCWSKVRVIHRQALLLRIGLKNQKTCPYPLKKYSTLVFYKVYRMY